MTRIEHDIILSENDALRKRYEAMKTAASELSTALADYLECRCNRSRLLNLKRDLDKLL